MEARGGGELVQEELEVAGVRRSYWLARAPRRHGEAAPPLLVVLHGPGMDGRAMASFTGLARRGPAAGITTVFPDGWKGAWHAVRPPAGQPNLDDARFLAELATHLEIAGAARSWPVFLAGFSQGARYAEHVARNGLLPVTGLFLVAGTALEFSRRQVPLPQLRASVILVMGTDDKTAPYAGGPLTRNRLSGLIRKRPAARHGEPPGADIVAGAEDVVADWAAANGITANGASASGASANGANATRANPSGASANGNWANGNWANGDSANGNSANGNWANGNWANGNWADWVTANWDSGDCSRAGESPVRGTAAGRGGANGHPGNGNPGGGIAAAQRVAEPVTEVLPAAPADLPVTRKSWDKPGCRPVTLYRIEGGGHGWPGGPQFMPARAIGPVARHLDATGLLLDLAERETAIARGRPVLGPGGGS